MKTMVVTGASTGVGRAISLQFADRGYRVFALARSKDKLNALAREHESIRPYPCDVTQKNQVRRTFESILSECVVDVLVNNAGITPAGREINPETIDEVIDTNLKGTMYCTYAILDAMKANGGGTIVNIASIAGVDIAESGSNGLYAASKHGQVAFADALGRKVRKEGIHITTLCPGGIDTPLWGASNPYPLGKENMIRPEEVADLIRYILEQPRRTLFKNVIFVPAVEAW